MIEYKQIYLTYQRIKYNDKGQTYKCKPFSVAFSYCEYLGKIPIETIIEKLDEAYLELKRSIIEELQNE